MLSLLVGRRKAKRVHSTLESAVEVPSVSGIEYVLQLTLACKELVHLVLVLIILWQAKLLVNLFVLSQGVNNALNTLLYDFFHRLLIVEVRVLWQIAHGVTW